VGTGVWGEARSAFCFPEKFALVQDTAPTQAKVVAMLNPNPFICMLPKSLAGGLPTLCTSPKYNPTFLKKKIGG
jgi:hypothetical protein